MRRQVKRRDRLAGLRAKAEEALRRASSAVVD
jgi:hypothetical protein